MGGRLGLDEDRGRLGPGEVSSVVLGGEVMYSVASAAALVSGISGEAGREAPGVDSELDTSL